MAIYGGVPALLMGIGALFLRGFPVTRAASRGGARRARETRERVTLDSRAPRASSQARLGCVAWISRTRAPRGR